MKTDSRVLAGRYEVGELIGRGGMAEVHAGRDTVLGRDVAIKILRNELARDPEFRGRFQREAKAAAKMNNARIVSVYDWGDEPMTELGGAELNIPFIVMELLPGRTLRAVLNAGDEQRGRLHPHRAARLMKQVLQALAYSHAQGIIHRDIKPGNVMIDEHDEAKVMDFGIARALADTAATMTHSNVVVGTAQYLSPEQARGRDVDTRTDIYAAGCVLYELVTGRPPFVGETPVAIAYQHCGELVTPPSKLCKDVPLAMDAIILHALVKEQEDRYQTPEEMIDDLDAFLAGYPISAAAQATLANPDRVTHPLSKPLPTVVAPEDVDLREHTAGIPIVGGPRRKRPWGWIALVSVLLAAIVAGVVFVAKPFRSDAVIPNVMSKVQAEAEQEVRSLGLEPVIVKRAHADANGKGTVLDQNPRYGLTVPLNSKVTLFVSEGPISITIRPVRDYELGVAQQLLKEQGLNLGDVVKADEPAADAGRVSGTEPPSGMTVPFGTTVKVKVATGKVKVPDLRGKSIEEVRAILADARLVPNVIANNQSSKPQGTVLRIPKANEVVPFNTTVDVYVSARNGNTSTEIGGNGPGASPSATPGVGPSVSPPNGANQPAPAQPTNVPHPEDPPDGGIPQGGTPDLPSHFPPTRTPPDRLPPSIDPIPPQPTFGEGPTLLPRPSRPRQ